MTSVHYICSYENPDTDGVCSAIAYAHLKEKTGKGVFVPLVFGKMDKETQFVLTYFGVQFPTCVSKAPTDGPIILVDTHHRHQLPENFPFDNVIEIIDHHPAGDPSLFPKAHIQNELVGAVATLITERFQRSLRQIGSNIAGILTAAILSNTLNLCAPSTSNRDHSALRWLSRFVNIDDSFVQQMFTERSDIRSLSTYEVLEKDFKKFVIHGKVIGISQLETVDSPSFFSREDIAHAIDKVTEDYSLDIYFVNVVDLVNRESTFVATNLEARELIEILFGVHFIGVRAKYPGILLRKTDLIPALQRYFAT